MPERRNWKRHAVEIVVIVSSILLAFGIQAWWDENQERGEEQRILTALLEESRVNGEWLGRMIPYHQAQVAAVTVLLNEAADEVPRISADSVDHLLINLTQWYFPQYERGAVDAALLGGKLELIEDDGLRSLLSGWPVQLEKAALRVADEKRVYADVWTPFLRKNASMPQISNAQTDLPSGIDDSYSTLTAVRETIDHTELLRVQEFVNILLERKWVHEDAVNDYSDIQLELDALVRALESEIGSGLAAR